MFDFDGLDDINDAKQQTDCDSSPTQRSQCFEEGNGPDGPNNGDGFDKASVSMPLETHNLESRDQSASKLVSEEAQRVSSPSSNGHDSSWPPATGSFVHHTSLKDCPQACTERLCVVAECTGWDPSCQDLWFNQMWGESPHGLVRHQLCICLDDDSADVGARVRNHKFVSFSFQVISADKRWTWRIYPQHTSKRQGSMSWGEENVLCPGRPDAVPATQGQEGHGRCFHIVEERGSVITICIELNMSSTTLLTRVWYEKRNTDVSFTGCDPEPVKKRHTSLALQLRGLDLKASKHNKSLSSQPCSARIRRTSSRPSATETPENAISALHGSFGQKVAECLDPLVLVCDYGGWDPKLPDLRLQPLWAHIDARDNCTVRHQLCVRLADSHSLTRKGIPVPWNVVLLSLSFQILSVQKAWDCRIYPANDIEGWGPHNVLVPGNPEAVRALQGHEGHGCNFHLVEHFGTVFTICVELSMCLRDPAPRRVSSRVWYEVTDTQPKAVRATVRDKQDVQRDDVILAFNLRGEVGLQVWDKAIKAGCPDWWKKWDKHAAKSKALCWESAETFFRGRKNSIPDSAVTNMNTNHTNSSEVSGVASHAGFRKDEALSHLQWCISYLSEKNNKRVLDECRKNATQKWGLTETFPFMPPRVQVVIGKMVDEVLKKAGCDTFLAFLNGFASVWGDPLVGQAADKLAKMIEEDDTQGRPRQRDALAVINERGALAACGTRLIAGTRVMLRWAPDSEGARYLTYLNGHVGVLNEFDKSTLRWQVGFETFDGNLMVASEHLHVVNTTVASASNGHTKREELNTCEMCLGSFMEMQIITVDCEAGHHFCNNCLRKWVLTQLVPRCYRCLDEAMALVAVDNCGGEPWLATPLDEGAVSNIYRISKEEIDKIPCLCEFRLAAGARCLIVGLQGLSGKSCIVGRVEKTRSGSFAAVFLKSGKKLEVATACLEVDDCLSAGRVAKGERCPVKEERLGLSLSCISIGCACPVKQTLDDLYIAQFAMPYDWLVSRIEGVMYFFRHRFRDFCHYDDVKVVGEHGFTSYRAAYHAFPHHDVSSNDARDRFERRGLRLYHQVKCAGEEATTRPILLIRILASTEEVTLVDELYATIRNIGGQKVYLLVMISEQHLHLQGAVQHLRHPNLLIYICGTGGLDLADGVRYAMDFSYSIGNFGFADLSLARRTSSLSPIWSGADLQCSLTYHARWLEPDRKGLYPTSNLPGMDYKHPNQYFPGKFDAGGCLPSPYWSDTLERAVSRKEIPQLLHQFSRGTDVNAWNAKGETVLFHAVRDGDISVCALLLLAAADPNCRDRAGLLPVDHLETKKSKERKSGMELALRGTRQLRILLDLFSGSNTALNKIGPNEIQDVLDAVPEPSCRRIVSRLGLLTSPDLLPEKAPILSVPVSAQALFAAHMLQDAEARSNDHATALMKLREAAGLDLSKKRKFLRALLFNWHPDKHQSATDEVKEHANNVFCYIQGLRSLFLGLEDSSNEAQNEEATT